jgi:hypothetical protein
MKQAMTHFLQSASSKSQNSEMGPAIPIHRALALEVIFWRLKHTNCSPEKIVIPANPL